MRRLSTAFARRVETMVRTIPRGLVATYGQIAALCDSPRAARQIGWILQHTFAHVPWQRVINREGRLSIQHSFLTAEHQAALLRKEGIRVAKHAGAYWVDLNTYLWNPDVPVPKRQALGKKRHAGVVQW